MHELVE